GFCILFATRFSLRVRIREPGATDPYTLSLHDASSDLGGSGSTRTGLAAVFHPFSSPLALGRLSLGAQKPRHRRNRLCSAGTRSADRKSTRLNSSHVKISYAAFCWKKNDRTTDHS